MAGPAQTSLRPASASAWQMYRTMVGVGILCGLLIVTVYQWTLPIIERNKAAALQRAILQVLPQASSSASFRLNEQERFEPAEAKSSSGALVYAGYDEQQQLVGLAVEAQGMGYQDVIRLLYGYSVTQEAIIGIRVLESKETPGLGDKIESDPGFLANFERLDVALDDSGSAPAHPIEVVKHGAKTQAWQVDGITGATISSAAIAGILAESTAYWIPRLRGNLEDFRAAAAPATTQEPSP